MENFIFKIDKTISSKVLTVGVEYINHRGGIGGVIDSYSNYFSVFNFIATYKPQKYKVNVIFYFLYACFKLCGFLIKNSKIEIVHIHGAAKGSIVRKFIIFFISKYVFNKRVIYHSHGSELMIFYNKTNILLKNLMVFFFNKVDLIVCLSEKWKSFFLKEFNPNDILVLENIVEKPDKYVFQSEIKLPLKFLFLGLIGERKGIFDLLEAIKNRKDYFDNKIELLIGGNGQIDRLKKYVNEYGLESIVKYQGWVIGEKKKELLKSCNLYILPSYNEGLPLSILEAMTYSLPIISTPVGGISEIVKENYNGFLINPGDIKTLEKTIMWFLNNVSSIESMGAHSFELVEPYLAHNVIPKLNLIYVKLLK